MKRKYKQGEPVESVDTLYQHEFFIVHYGRDHQKTVHREFLLSQPVRSVKLFIDSRRIFVAYRLTNGEFYSDKTDEDLLKMLDESICNYCPEGQQLEGVHDRNGCPVMCEGRWCDNAFEAWKEDEVE